MPVNNWGEDEILDHSGEVNLDRLNSIGVLLYNHDRDSVIGKIQRAWIENGRGMAEVEFDTDEFSESIYQKVRSGTLRGVSVGYCIHEYIQLREDERSSDERFTGPAFIATRWEPFEISIVSVPADPTVGVGRSKAQLTSSQQGANTAQLHSFRGGTTLMGIAEMLERQRALLDTAQAEHRSLTDEERAEYDALQRQILELSSRASGDTKDDEKDTGTSDSSGSSSGASEDKEDQRDAAEIERRAIANERARVNAIRSMCAEWDLDPDDYITRGTSVDEARAKVLRSLQRDRSPIPMGIQVTDEMDRFRNAAVDALCMRAGVPIDKPAQGSRDLMGMSLRDMAIRCLAAEGVAGLHTLIECSSDQLLKMCSMTFQPMGARAFMQPTGQFPVLLDQTIDKALVEWYKHPDYQFERICKIGTLSDFKPHDNNYMSGPVGDFPELPEGGEMKEDTFTYEKLGQRKIKTYAKRISLTYQAFVNDDIGLVAEMPRKFARAWRRTINNMVFSALVDNEVLQDGAQLFSAAHKNCLSEGTTVNTESITSMRYALRKQTDLFGEPITITPKTLIVPTGLDYDIATLFMSPTIQTVSNTQAINPLFNLGLEIIEDEAINTLASKAGLETVPWFMAGDAADAPGIEVDYLNGQSKLQRRIGQPMDQLGFVWNFWGFAGVTVTDYRRYVKNPGIAIKPAIALV